MHKVYLLSFLIVANIANMYSAFAGDSVESFKTGDIMTINGYIDTDPEYYSGDGGRFQSWSFNFSALPRERGGPQHEYIMVTFHTYKLGKQVATWPSYKRGDKISLEGKFFKATQKNSSGLLGSFYVNDKDIKELNP